MSRDNTTKHHRQHHSTCLYWWVLFFLVCVSIGNNTAVQTLVTTTIYKRCSFSCVLLHLLYILCEPSPLPSPHFACERLFYVCASVSMRKRKKSLYELPMRCEWHLCVWWCIYVLHSACIVPFRNISVAFRYSIAQKGSLFQRVLCATAVFRLWAFFCSCASVSMRALCSSLYELPVRCESHLLVFGLRLRHTIATSSMQYASECIQNQHKRIITH